MKRTYVRAVACAAALLSVQAANAATTIQPGEADSKDVFVYAFDVPGAFGLPGVPSDRNWDATTPDVGPFGAFLGAAKTEPFNDPNAVPPTPPGVPERRHDSNILVEFDLSDVELSSAQVANAHLVMTGAGALGAFDAPTPAFPVTVDVRPVLQAWDELTVTWNSRPMVGEVIANEVMTFGTQVLKFDLTEQVSDWLAMPGSNFGVELSQRSIVQFPAEDGETRGRFAAALFASSANPDLAGPTLQIAPVPVPAALPLMIGGVAALGVLRRRATAR